MPETLFKLPYYSHIEKFLRHYINFNIAVDVYVFENVPYLCCDKKFTPSTENK
jgi:hypothetical protein